MIGSLFALALSMTLFVVSHIVLTAPGVRPRLAQALGEKAFRVAYSGLAAALLVWAAAAYRAAPYVELWFPETFLRHISLTVMPLAFVLLVGGVTAPNPSALGVNSQGLAAGGPVGMLKITRHPVMWAIALWGVVHLIARGDAASVILFGGLAVLALAGAKAQDVKKRKQLGDAWADFEDQTSFVPFAALARAPGCGFPRSAGGGSRSASRSTR